ncbi:hypothetical protein IFO69_06510 [Echinicola sp. CAU 1574]|uniref:Glycoside hydrolase 123-like N-terminal domain-containing protein n=1 Tax=Echinicola arenosa TaxID=2774144 RepID=A0ABR9AI48_9BACT|nr:hypothetical protein [Echinicola arenosa]
MQYTFYVENAHAQQHIYPPQQELWDADSLGNQRAVVLVNKIADQVTVEVEWRNRNVTSQQKVYVVDSTTQNMVEEVLIDSMSPEKGKITFTTSGRKGIFYIYYLPYKVVGRRNYPDVVYEEQITNKTNEKQLRLSNENDVKVLRLEAVDDFNSNKPMEIIATQKEVEAFRAKHRDKSYLVFPEDRDNPIKMKDYLPQKWAVSTLESTFSREVCIKENYTFQLGLWAKDQALKNIKVTFSKFKSENGDVLPLENFTCFNKEGVDYTGKSFSKTVDVEEGKIQALWCGITIPDNNSAAKYSGAVTILPEGQAPTEIPVELIVSQKKAINGGVNEPWKQTRLNWLNSTLAQENSVIAPYIPLKVEGHTISLLGRKVWLGSNGLPAQIQSFFAEEMTSISKEAKDMIADPFSLNILKENGQHMVADYSGPVFKDLEEGKVSWKSIGKSQELEIVINGSLEFDGFANFEIKVVALQDVELKDIALDIPVYKTSSKYMLGLGYKGQHTPRKIDWKWDVAHKNQDGWWLGSVNSGMQLSLRDQHYERPLNTNFYLQKPLKLPLSWGNDNKGGISMVEDGDVLNVHHYSGDRKMEIGDTLYFNFTLLITPFHTLQTDDQWRDRYYHAYQPVDTVVKSGASIVNIHHANEINPYINYPFIATKEMKAYIDAAHERGLKVKIYNTVREVSNRLYELYPLRSLNHEVFSEGNGGGFSWLQEHLQRNYIAAWYVPRFKDAAIINSGMNRWHNYYVEGMNWLVQNIGIDGIYLDDVAFDRITMKRIKRVLTKQGHPGLIDLHSANQYNERDGYNNSANLYMEHFPYINRLWFGEYFDYEKGSPEFYLTEVSGIPFGLMGEMLQDGGNPWRGMLYGMTNRMPYQEERPDHIWKAWDDFGMEGVNMIGYWVSDSPVKTNHEKVLATVYKKEGKALVSVASWAEDDVRIKLEIDWKSLGIDPNKIKISAPEIQGFQPSKTFDVSDQIPVEKNKGWMLVIE